MSRGTSRAVVAQTVNFRCTESGPATLIVHHKWEGDTSGVQEVPSSSLVVPSWAVGTSGASEVAVSIPVDR